MAAKLRERLALFLQTRRFDEFGEMLMAGWHESHSAIRF